MQVELQAPPSHALEEAVIEELATMSGTLAPAFAAAIADGVTTVGATFLPSEPAHAEVAATVRACAVFLLSVVIRTAPRQPRVRAAGVARRYPLSGRYGYGPGVAHRDGPGDDLRPGDARIAVDALLGCAVLPAALDVARSEGRSPV